jgi:hypothetical protein
MEQSRGPDAGVDRHIVQLREAYAYMQRANRAAHFMVTAATILLATAMLLMAITISGKKTREIGP